jgi:hypothetical protein
VRTLTPRLRRRLLAAAAFSLLLAGAPAPFAEGERTRVEAGLYEVTLRFDDVSIPGMLPEEVAALKKQAAEKFPPTRNCKSGRRAKVGGKFHAGRCRYARVADRGAAVDRSAICKGEGGSAMTMEFIGTSAPAHYSYRVKTRSTDVKTGRLVMEMHGVEEGRRVGKCP